MTDERPRLRDSRVHTANNPRARAVSALGVAFVLALFACESSTTPQTAVGQLMIAIDTDMAIPKDLDTVRIEVVAAGVLQLGADYALGAGKLTLPATLALLPGKNPADPVTVRVIGKRGTTTRTLREVVTTVPTDRLATLRMPMEWLCVGTVKDDASGGLASSCAAGQTCAGGACVSSTVDATTLPTYRDADVFGGGTATGEGGTCFDTTACFAASTPAAFDAPSCSLEAPAAAAAGAINVAAVPSPPGNATDGICDATRCLVPLDGDFAGGWGSSIAGGRIVLPSGVCASIKRGVAMTFVTSAGCATKTAAAAPCGSWSTVTSSTGTGKDGGASDAAADQGAPQVSGKVACPDARLECDATPEAGCCWEAGNGAAVYRCAGPSACTGLPNACDGNEDCTVAAQVCCLNVKKGGACQKACNPTLEGERCALAPPAGQPNGCPAGKTCKGCATRLQVGSGLLGAPICVVNDTCPATN